MSIIGRVESLWRYPVKSMRGEKRAEVFIGEGGIAGDRLFAFHSSAARPEFPYFTARQQAAMLRYCPRFAAPNEQSVVVDTPAGETLAIDDPRLIESLREGVDPKHHVTLIRSERALTDTQPVSLISLQTADKLGEETGTAPEKRRFRANIYFEAASHEPFAENNYVGRSVRIGSDVVVAVLQRDVRCMMINLHPDTGVSDPAILKAVAQAHGGTAGVYCTVMSEGTVRKGDTIALI